MAKGTASDSAALYQSSKRSRRRPKRITLAIYHIGAVLVLAGILVAVAGIGSVRLFQVYIYDHRRPAGFHHLHLPVGLFSVSANVIWLNNQQSVLEHPLEIDDARWAAAKALALIGLFAGIGALILHFVLCCCQANRNWLNILCEVICLLVAVIALLIGLSLAESEIENIHDHGDEALTRMLVQNGLLSYPMMSPDAEKSGENQVSDTERLRQPAMTDSTLPTSGRISEFDLVLTPPQTSFYLLISADFLLLLGFLAVLIYFVRVCEKAEQARKQMQRAEMSHS